MRPQATKCTALRARCRIPTKPNEKKRVMLSLWLVSAVRTSYELRKMCKEKTFFPLLSNVLCGALMSAEMELKIPKVSRMKTIAFLFCHSLCAMHSISGAYFHHFESEQLLFVNGNWSNVRDIIVTINSPTQMHARMGLTSSGRERERSESEIIEVAEQQFRQTINSLTEFVFTLASAFGILFHFRIIPQKWVAKSNFRKGTFPFIESIQIHIYTYISFRISFCFAFDFCENCKATEMALCVVFIYNITENAWQPAIVPQPPIRG